MRTQPCETRPGRICGAFVPWIPTKPPPGQSVSVVRPRVEPERARAVRRRVVAGELLAHVELAPRRRRVRLPDADPRREDGPAALVERGSQRPLHDHHARVHLLEGGQGAARHPAGRAVRQDCESDPHPRLPALVRHLVEHLDRVAVELGRPERDRRDRASRARRAGAGNGAVPDERPAVRFRAPIAEQRPLRVDACRIRLPGRRPVRATDPDHERARRAARARAHGERHPVHADLRPRRLPRVRRARRIPIRVAEHRALRRASRVPDREHRAPSRPRSHPGGTRASSSPTRRGRRPHRGSGSSTRRRRPWQASPQPGRARPHPQPRALPRVDAAECASQEFIGRMCPRA